MITKSILSVLFVVAALLQLHPIPSFYHYLLTGLVFCLIGDICLALPHKKAFGVGLVAFLLGHVLYLFGFSSLVGLCHWFSAWLFILFFMSALVFYWLRPHLGSMLVPVFLYVVVITIMVSGAWAVFSETSFQISGRAFILAGSLFFYFSDVFVARDKFIKEEYRNRLLGLPLYYSGQFLLAFSVGLLR